MTDTAPAPVRILLVEDDEAIRRSVGMALERYGYEVESAPDGLSGLEAFRAAGQPPQPGPDSGTGTAGRPYDLLILDVMLPHLDGIGLCHRVRESSQVPVLMMSARGDALDVVAGLEAGADDYVVKPVETNVLVARIRTLLRRAVFTARPGSSGTDGRGGAGGGGTGGGGTGGADGSGRTLVFRDLTVDTLGLEVRSGGEPVALTPTELRLLLEFVAEPGIALDRQNLLRKVWDYGWDGDSRVVDLTVQRLRKKIGADHIETVRGFGYRFRR
ncbi:response regulator transcription factor [Streptomyces sp. NPDC097619]|uniref:response regulator transcription factor n=1 Tax=Streptomyces sp. NPDC097619 TaxID=3157228 RepID=UPI003326762A